MAADVLGFEDLRGFLSYLEAKGELIRVATPMDWDLQAAGAIKEISCNRSGPALLFEKIKGYEGMTAVGGLFGTMERLASGLGSTPSAFMWDYIERMAKRVATAQADEAPVKSVIQRGDEVDILKFPIFKYCPKDGGRYLSATVVGVKDPDSSKRNASIHRLQVKGRNKLGIWTSIFHLWHIIEKHWKRGEPCPVAIAVGVDPATLVAAASKVPYEVDEYELAGSLRGYATKMVECESVPLEAPANAEIVIEGWIPPNYREPEGPFSEVMGYYGAERQCPVINISAIAHRADPIYHALINGRPPTEGPYLASLSMMGPICELVSKVVPPETIKGLHLPIGGCGVYSAVIAINKTCAGQGRVAGLAAIGIRNLKQVIVVDTDIDIYSEAEVEWAVTTRTKYSRDFIIIKDSIGMPLDVTAAKHDFLVDKLVIDATLPYDGDKELKKEVFEPGPSDFRTDLVDVGAILK